MTALYSKWTYLFATINFYIFYIKLVFQKNYRVKISAKLYKFKKNCFT